MSQGSIPDTVAHGLQRLDSLEMTVHKLDGLVKVLNEKANNLQSLLNGHAEEFSNYREKASLTQGSLESFKTLTAHVSEDISKLGAATALIQTGFNELRYGFVAKTAQLGQLMQTVDNLSSSVCRLNQLYEKLAETDLKVSQSRIAHFTRQLSDATKMYDMQLTRVKETLTELKEDVSSNQADLVKFKTSWLVVGKIVAFGIGALGVAVALKTLNVF